MLQHGQIIMFLCNEALEIKYLQWPGGYNLKRTINVPTNTLCFITLNK